MYAEWGFGHSSESRGSYSEVNYDHATGAIEFTFNDGNETVKKTVDYMNVDDEMDQSKKDGKLLFKYVKPSMLSRQVIFSTLTRTDDSKS